MGCCAWERWRYRRRHRGRGRPAQRAGRARAPLHCPTPHPAPPPQSPRRAAAAQVVKGVGGIEHAAWRAFRDERRSEPARNFIDGDLVESFLDLAPDQAAAVVGHMGPGHSVEEITRRVEELQRLH
jgi:hypothetical protein